MLASGWVTRWAYEVPSGKALLDVACGTGRHSLFFAARGVDVTAVDVSHHALEAIRGTNPTITTLCADLEKAAWPLVGQTFDAVVVTNYLWRPLFPAILASLKPDGVLIYETFAKGNEAYGKPSRPDFLLEPGELLRHCQNLSVVAYEEGFLSGPDRQVQRIVAVNRNGKMPVPTETLRFHL